MIVGSLLKVITQMILKYAFISSLLPSNSLYITTRLVSAENKLKGVWCFGKGWAILGSKLDGCFWFDVGILLYLNYESFFYLFFCLSLTLLFPVLAWRSPHQLHQTWCVQQDECWRLVSAHYLNAHPAPYHFLKSFLIQIHWFSFISVNFI